MGFWNKQNNSIGSKIKSWFSGATRESFEQIKQTGTDILTDAPRLPSDLLNGVPEVKKTDNQSGSSMNSDSNKPGQKDWADEWLKDKDPNKPKIAGKDGEHSNLDTQKMFKDSDEKQKAAIARQLHAMYSRPDRNSDYSREKAQKQQEENKPIYDKLWDEKKKKEEEEVRAKQQSGEGSEMPSSKQKGRGHKKKAQMPQFKSMENKASGGK